MGQYDDVVEKQRILLEAEEWAKGVKSLHTHSLTSMWYETEFTKKEIEVNGGVTENTVKHINGVKVCNEGGDIEIGDLLVTSSRPGYFMKQSDDLIRNYTAGKCGQNVVFGSETEKK